MLRLIEEIDSSTLVTIGGRSYPTACIVENDEDGLRWLVWSYIDRISPNAWLRGHSAGVSGIVVPDDDHFWVISTERFMEHRTESLGMYLIPSSGQTKPTFPGTTITPERAAPALVVPTSAGFVHLHTHSDYSDWDGLQTVQEAIDAAVSDNQPALAISDHGNCAAHPDLARLAKKAGIKPIFAIETYLVPDRFGREADVKYNHLILIAKTQLGLQNVWAASTEAYRDGLYDGHARLDWDTLARHSEGVICSTGCLSGPISKAILEEDEERARALLARLQHIYKDDLYVEIHTNSLPEQHKVNATLVTMARDFSIPMIGVVDSHFSTKEQGIDHKMWMACATRTTVVDDAEIFGFNGESWLLSEAEARDALFYLGPDVVDECITNTVVVADSCTATIGGKSTAPVFSKASTERPDPVQADVDRLIDLCMGAWQKKTTGKQFDQDTYMARFEREMGLLIAKGFCGYFLMVADYCLDPSTPVLTEDMRWVEVGKLEVGDRLAGFDEHKVAKIEKRHRYWRSAEVVATRRIVLPTYRVTLQDGTVTVTSGDHKWLVASPGGSTVRWIKTEDLRTGQRPQRLVDDWTEKQTWEVGYLAGILDGEGFLSQSALGNGGHSLTVGFAQNEGPVLDTTLGILDSLRFNYSVTDHSAGNRVKNVQILGGRAEVLRLLGMVRPQRLLAKLDVDLLGRVQAIASPAITMIESMGLGEVVALATTTQTLVAQGFAHHNCLAAKEGRIDGLASGKLTGNPILVGPGRGSGGGSLVAYLSGITGVDPVDADLLFERFLTEGRESLPDFDVDFPASKKQDLLAYVRLTWGEEYVATVGSHLRLKSKGIINSLSAARSEELPESAFLEFKAISKIITQAEAGTAGLGLTWEELWAQEGDLLEPYRVKYPDFFEQCGRLVNRLKTYGKHAAGVVISTDTPLTGSLPLRKTDDDGVTMMVTQFEKDALESMGLVKFDLLTIRTLDTIQMCVDLIRDQRGTSIDVEEWRDEYLDPQVWAEVKAAHTLGIFQIETGPGTALTRQMKPGSVAELADMITLVRPGPRRSGLTDKYLARRDGREAVSFPDPRMEQVLSKTYGCLLYQEDIMAACMVLAGYDGNEADEVRSILGKKKVEKIPAAGEKFIRESVARGMVHSDAAALWAQMAEFAKYSFNRAHAFAYAVIGYWCAWLKFHYPVQFLTAVLSTLDERERIPAFITEARRMGYSVLPPDINESRNDFTGSPLAVRYGFSALKSMGNAGNIIAEHQPFTSYEDFIERVILNKDNPVHMGQTRVLAQIGAFDTLVPNRAGLIEKIDQEKSGEATRCQHKNEAIPLDIRPFNPTLNKNDEPGERLPCLFAWEDLPEIVGRTGKPLKDQSKRLPARKCSKACSQYVSVPSFDIDIVQPFSAKEIRDIEHEMLGVYLSSTPFDMLDPADREECRINADTLEEGPDGVYFTAGLVVGIDPRKTKSSGEDYANITIETEGGTFRCSAFDLWRTSTRDDIVMGQLAFVEIKKKSPFYNLVTYLGVS